MPTGFPYVPAIFCDETGMHGSRYVYLGALRCSYRRSQIIGERLAHIRKNRKLVAEMKWTKVSKKFLGAYREWVDVFLQDKACRFLVMRAPRSAMSRCREEGFFNIYRRFLARVVRPTRGCYVWVDGSTLRRRSRWSSLAYRVNRSRRENWALRGRNIRELKVVEDSRDNDLIQLTDVLLGAVASLAAASLAEPKRCLADHLAPHVTETADAHQGYSAKIWLFDYQDPPTKSKSNGQ